MNRVILNADLSFDRADEQVRKAFVGPPDKMLLLPPTQLYKLTHRPLFGIDGVTPWWFFFERTLLPNGRVAEGRRASQERARRLKTSEREYARARGAVSDEFGNRMDALLVVELNLPVWGFVGKVGGQPEFAREWTDLQHVYLIGGDCQLWIPNLTRAHVRQAPRVA